MKQYAIEGGNPVALAPLEADFMSDPTYRAAHAGMVIACHDIMIAYEGGFLMIVRDNEPAKGELWCIGGRQLRGLSPEDSALRKAKAECNLELYDLQTVGCARTYFQTDPFGHGRGTDSFNVMLFARGRGALKLDALHSDPVIVRPDDYTPDFQRTLHPYMRDFFELVWPLV
ncbi:hypothetical protein SAMN05421823_104429 [Catalinimonas alkaloidigena]|uniref:Nudix hydrolase domain-containing protein n=1 Tax=Catalinimonas alkaloidigena TaxID=1075417 RepID=A0A1G9HGY8_9BACT|nr:hypothetical protein [Catalinimonas alkaloidigena]SDL12004.1 hypothetical protein SAMN05421823_104429 [Catalinimonas alkaloidigena]